MSITFKNTRKRGRERGRQTPSATSVSLRVLFGDLQGLFFSSDGRSTTKTSSAILSGKTEVESEDLGREMERSGAECDERSTVGVGESVGEDGGGDQLSMERDKLRLTREGRELVEVGAGVMVCGESGDETVIALRVLLISATGELRAAGDGGDVEYWYELLVGWHW